MSQSQRRYRDQKLIQYTSTTRVNAVAVLYFSVLILLMTIDDLMRHSLDKVENSFTKSHVDWMIYLFVVHKHFTHIFT